MIKRKSKSTKNQSYIASFYKTKLGDKLIYKLILKIRCFIQTDKIYLVLLLLLIPILNGCSSKPSESKAREALQLYLE
jgi:hypothetical protein